MAGGRKDPTVNADGFTAVERGSGGPRDGGDNDGGAAHKTEGSATASGSARPVDDNGDADATMGGQDVGPGGADPWDSSPREDPGDDHDGGQGGKDQVDVEALRGRWEREKELVELLRRQEREEDDPLLADAERRCEEAKAEWEAARGPLRMSRPLGRAEAAVRKARARQAAAEQALDDLDREYECKRQEFENELAEARSLAKRREAELTDLQRKLGGQCAAKGQDAAGQATISEMARRIDGLAPALQALLEKLPSGSEAHEAVAYTMAELAGVSGVASEAAAGRRDDQAQTFDIGGGAGADDCCSELGDVGTWGSGEGGHQQRGGPSGCQDGWGDSHYGSWHHGTYSSHHDHVQGYSGYGYWAGGYGAWDGGEQREQHVGGRAEVSTGDASAWANEEERQRAAKVYAEQKAAQANGGFATPQATAIAAELHGRLVAEVKQRAEARAVSYAGVDLDNMPTAELEEWARANLDQPNEAEL